MRETKFRAWDKKRKGWIQGFNLYNFHDYYNKGTEPRIGRYELTWMLSEIELIECTGLKDRNNVEIYEGDILKQLWGIEKKGVVEFDKKCAQFRFSAHTIYNDFACTSSDDYEIIGNIYNNPELMEKHDKSE